MAKITIEIDTENKASIKQAIKALQALISDDENVIPIMERGVPSHYKMVNAVARVSVNGETLNPHIPQQKANE